MTLDKKAWVFRREAPVSDYFTIHELLQIMAETISCGGECMESCLLKLRAITATNISNAQNIH